MLQPPGVAIGDKSCGS